MRRRKGVVFRPSVTPLRSIGRSSVDPDCNRVRTVPSMRPRQHTRVKRFLARLHDRDLVVLPCGCRFMSSTKRQGEVPANADTRATRTSWSTERREQPRIEMSVSGSAPGGAVFTTTALCAAQLPRWWCLNGKFVSGGGLVTFDRATKCNRLASFCELTS